MKDVRTVGQLLFARDVQEKTVAIELWHGRPARVGAEHGRDAHATKDMSQLNCGTGVPPVWVPNMGGTPMPQITTIVFCATLQKTTLLLHRCKPIHTDC